MKASMDDARSGRTTDDDERAQVDDGVGERDLPYDESTLKQATIVARSVERQIAAKAKDKESRGETGTKWSASAKIIRIARRRRWRRRGLTMGRRR